MWQALVVCSSCAEEREVVVDDLEDELDREVCSCGYSYVVLSIAAFEPARSERAELIELPAQRKLPLAA